MSRSKDIPQVPIDRFGFKRSRWIFYANITDDDIQKVLEAIGGNGTDLDSFKKFITYVKARTCRYCLNYGHTCDPFVYPPNCTNLPKEFTALVEFFSQKYKIEKRIVSKLALCHLGYQCPLPRSPNCVVWSWVDFEKSFVQVIRVLRKNTLNQSNYRSKL